MGPTPVGDADGEAFDRFYRSEIHVLTTLAASLTGDVGRAAEIAQEALLRAYRVWPRVSRLDKPGAWVRRVTMNLAIDATRRVRSERRAHGRVATAGATEPVYDVDDAFWLEVRRLPERQRAVVALRYVDDMSLEDIGRTMGISVGTVKSALFAARRTLSERLQLEEGLDVDVR
jgi:RNA polymerase sigma-70 factor (sigma-E family)